MIDINQVQRDFDNGVMLCRETIRQVIELAAVKNADARKLARAERALVRAGFQDLGGEEWKPPLGKRPDFTPKLVPMRDDKITVIPQNMREYQISVRETDFENDLFSKAFDDACKEGQVSSASEEAMRGIDWFKDGWNAAVRCLAAPISKDSSCG